MTTPKDLLDKTLQIMQRHIYQVEAEAMQITKDGKMRGFSASDSQILERYAKVLQTMIKTPTSEKTDELDNLSDEELLRELEEEDNDSPETDEN